MHKHADVKPSAPWFSEITIDSNFSSALLKIRGIGTAMDSGILTPDKYSNESKYKNKVHQLSTSTQAEAARSPLPTSHRVQKAQGGSTLSTCLNTAFIHLD